MTDEGAQVIAINAVLDAQCENYHDARACLAHHEGKLDSAGKAALRLAIQFYRNGFLAGADHVG